MDITPIDKALIAQAWTSSEAYLNLEQLCSIGSRFAGTPSETQARDYIAAKLREYGLDNVHTEAFEYLGWYRGTCSLRVVSPPGNAYAISLVYSPSTPPGGLTAAVVDVGIGTEEEYARKADSLRGKFVLCSSANPAQGPAPHRREKYGRAVDAGAIGFIYSRHLPGGMPETGSLRPGRMGEIPAVAVSYETGFALKRLISKGETVVTMDVQNMSHPAVAYHVAGEVPGRTDEIILIGGHYDGHDISQGAMDNASGVSLVLELARLFAPLRGQLHRSLRFVTFDCEELGVVGSTEYVSGHWHELDKIALMVNLDDAVGGGSKGFDYGGMEDVGTTLAQIAAETEYPLKLSTAVVTASDNFPFFMQGIPAITMSGEAHDRAIGRGYGHTPMDTLDKVSDHDLKESTMVAARVLLRLAEYETIGAHRTPAQLKEILISQDLEKPLRAQGKWRFS